MDKKLITIVTPTYNRGYILNKCYESLKNQTNLSFSWMVIDDGSTDNTEKLVKKWIDEKKINISYYKKENGGKASALNLALEKINTKYFVCLDSDDTFSKKAVELAIINLNQIEKDEKYAGIFTLRNKPDGNVIGGKSIPENVVDITLIELYCIYKIKTEITCFYKTEVIKKIRFPEFFGEKFISPAYMEHEIGRQYRFLVSREVYCYCEYLPDGLTKNKINVIKKNPKGYTLIKKISYELAIGIIPKSKEAIMYIAGGILSGDKKIIANSPNKLMTMVLYPLGWLAYKIKFR